MVLGVALISAVFLAVGTTRSAVGADLPVDLELVLAVDVRANVLPVYDSTAIHARAAAEWMLAQAEEVRAAA